MFPMYGANMNQGGMFFPGYNMNMQGMQGVNNQGMNFGMNNQGMNIGLFDMNNNINVPGMNFGGNSGWAQGYHIQNKESNIISGNKINCIFNTSSGKTLTILIDYGKTINDLIKIYFARLGQPELMNKKDEICFVFNATKIEIDNQEKVENFFKMNANPKILVNDVHNLIGASQ